MGKTLSSLRVRVLFLVAIPFLATLGLTINHALKEYDHRLAAAHAGALQSAKNLAAEQQRLIRHTRQVLTALAATPAIQQLTASPECSRILSDKLREGPDFATLIVSLANGDVICNAVPTPRPINIADRHYFKMALQQRKFVVGEYIVSRTTGKPAFGAAYPLLDDGGIPRGVVSASVGLDWLALELARASLPDGTHVIVLDAQGNVLVQHPGDARPTENAASTNSRWPSGLVILPPKEEGTVVAVGPDGRERIYGSSRLHRSDSSEVYLLVGVPKDTVLQPAQRELLLTLLAVLPLLTLTFVAIWFGSDRYFARPIVALARAAAELARGNLGARAPSASADDEIGRLAISFNRMAEVLQLKDHQVSQANRALRVISAGNRAMLRATDEKMLIDELCREIVEAGGYRMAWIGYADNDKEKTVRPAASYGAEPGFLERLQITWADTERGRGPSGRAIRDGVPVTARDTLTDRDYGPWRDLAHQHGYGSSVALPIKIYGKTIGALNIYACEPDAFGEEEIKLLSDAAADLSFGFVVQRANAERRRMQENLLAAEQRYYSLLSASPDGIWIHREGRISYANDALVRMLGYSSKEDLLGRDIFEFFPEEEREALRVRVRYTTTVLKPTPVTQTSLLRSDATPIGVETTAASYFQDGKPWSIAIIRDVTERRRMEQQIRALNEDLERRVAERTADLERANQELDSFSYSVSHDLRAPLRAISGFLHVLREKIADGLGQEERGLMDRIARNSERMSDLIDDLLSLSRVGRTDFKRSKVDLNALVTEAVANSSTAFPRTVVSTATLPHVACDPALVRQVFENLIDNAFKYSGKKENPRVEIGTAIRSGKEVFYVRDNGVGFDMKDADKLFEVFQRLHSDTQFSGTGVGLAIVKRIVERHGGRVWAESAPDAGTTFCFTLG